MSLISKTNKDLMNNDLDSKKDLIKRMFCKNSTDDELELFLHACKRTGLDPFMKQIYAIKRGAQLTIQTGIDGLRLIAERTGNYSPGKAAEFSYDAQGKLESATSFIKKRTEDGIWHEISATAFFEEYCIEQGLWKKMPRVMLAKCAEALALKKAFPAEMSGVYSEEEMEQAGEGKKISETIPELSYQDYENGLDILLDELERRGQADFLEEFKARIFRKMKVDSFYKVPEEHRKTVLDSLQSRINKLEEEVKHESATA